MDNFSFQYDPDRNVCTILGVEWAADIFVSVANREALPPEGIEFHIVPNPDGVGMPHLITAREYAERARRDMATTPE